MIFNRAGGGGEKVKIDNKPVSQRLDLKSGIGIVERENVFPEGRLRILGHLDDIFYITLDDKYLYKGNLNSEWTLEFDFSTIPNFNTNYICFIEIQKTYCKICTQIVKDTSSMWYTDTSIYKIENGQMTLLETFDSYRYRVNTFILNGAVYSFSTEYGNYLYRISNPKTSFGTIPYSIRIVSNYKNNRYFLQLKENEIVISKFDGKKIEEQMFEYNYIYPKGCDYYADNSYLANPTSLAFLIKEGANKYNLMNETFKIVDSGKQGYAINSEYILIKENERYKHISRLGRDIVEFPIKVYS